VYAAALGFASLTDDWDITKHSNSDNAERKKWRNAIVVQMLLIVLFPVADFSVEARVVEL
jgi:hypothetical protein